MVCQIYGTTTRFICNYGEIIFTDAELREAGIRATFLPRWTHPGEPRSEMVYFTPRKNVELLDDFLRLFMRDLDCRC